MTVKLGTFSIGDWGNVFPSDKAERKRVSLRLNLILFLAAYIVGALATINLPLVKSGEMPYWMFLCFNGMWV